MRLDGEPQAGVISGLAPDAIAPQGHALRRINALVDSALRGMSPLISQSYADSDRPSIPDGRLLKASQMMGFYAVRLESHDCEEMSCNLSFE